MKIEDSHSDDISAIMFHPTKPKMLFTGGLDMLVNNFNLEYENEDDALEHGLSILSLHLSHYILSWLLFIINATIV